MMAGAQLLIHHRHLLWMTTVNDVRVRYAGTVFGIAWALLYPLLFLGLYAAVYTAIFKVRIGGLTDFEYVLVLFAGLIPFLGLAEALGAGIGSVLANKGLVKNTLFPIELIPVKAVLVGSLTMLVGLAMLQAILWARGVVHLSQLAGPLILALQLVFTIGFIWLLSALNVLFRDLGQAISLLVLVLMVGSPIAYTNDMVPPALMPVMYVNPLYYLTTLYRECLIGGHVPMGPLLAFTAIAVGTFWCGHYVFSRFKEIFAEHV